MAADEGTLDGALEELSVSAPDFANGNSNHGPMVVETLAALGRSQAISAWLDGYRGELRERPARRQALKGDPREALGRADLWSDWVAYFERQMAQSPWRSVLGEWLPLLLPGLSGEATHGIIRTAHAARGVERRETPQRLAELADGLAYWASTYHAFKAGGCAEKRLAIDEAISGLPSLEVAAGGNIDERLRRLDDEPRFASVRGMLAVSSNPLAQLSRLTERSASLYLANAHLPKSVFPLIHALTGPAALRLLAGYLSAAEQRAALPYVWETAAAIYSLWGRETGPELEPVGGPDDDELIEAAVANGAAHAIKFAEACLRENALNPRPVYAAAAAEAVRRLDG